MCEAALVQVRARSGKSSVGFGVQRQLSGLADLQVGDAALSRLEERLGRVHARQRPFNGFSILRLSDLHCDTSERAMPCVTAMLGRVNFASSPVTTGKDVWANEPSLRGFATVRSTIRDPVYGPKSTDKLRMRVST